MGFRIKKSIKAGPFRINFSKSGVGYSFGGKGARIAKKGGGGTRTTLSLPGTGLSYVKESGFEKKTTPPSRRTSNSITAQQQLVRSTPDPVSSEKNVLFHIVGLADHVDNLKKLARSNPNWNLTPDQILAAGKEGRKVYQLTFTSNPVRLKEEVSQGVSIAVFVADLQIGYIAPEETGTVKKLLQHDLIRNMVCIINGGTYKIISEFGETQTGKQGFAAGIKVSYRVPAAVSTITSGNAEQKQTNRSNSYKRKTRRKHFYQRWWFWVLAILLLLGSCGSEKDVPEDPAFVADTSYHAETLSAYASNETNEPPAIQTTEAPTFATAEATLAPIVAPAPAEKPEDNDYTYILNTSTKKFHYQSCSSVKKIKAANKSSFTGTREQIVKKGYDPCGNCHP